MRNPIFIRIRLYLERWIWATGYLWSERASSWKWLWDNAKQIEIFSIIIWILLVWYQIVQTNESINLTRTAVELTEKQLKQNQIQLIVAHSWVIQAQEQNKISRDNLQITRQFEELRFLSDISDSFEVGVNAQILENFRKKWTQLFEEVQILNLLNKFEYLKWATEQYRFDDNAIRVNFWGYLKTLCNNNYLMEVVSTHKYGGIPVLCIKFGGK